MRIFALLLGSSLLLIASQSFSQRDGFKAIFDGETLSGWEGNANQFRVENEAIVAGNLNSTIELNEFLCTTEEYSDFELLVEAKILGDQIPGVSFRAERVQGSTEVSGYQADMGYLAIEFIPFFFDENEVDMTIPYPLWGSLLDEFRPEKSRYPDPNAPYSLLAVADKDAVEGVLKPSDWNQISIVANGQSIELFLNGLKTVDFKEEESVSGSGHICLQIHFGTPAKVEYRNIYINECE